MYFISFLVIVFFCVDRSCDTLLANAATSLVVPAIGIIVFALWGFLPLVRDIRNRFDVCVLLHVTILYYFSFIFDLHDHILG